MPTVTDTEVEQAYAHCTQPRCPGNSQEQVRGIARETSHSFVERGGDLPGTESSWVHMIFADEADIPCPACGKAREITDQRRKTYPALSGHNPMGLLETDPFDARKQTELRHEIASKGVDPEKVALEQQVEALTKALAESED